MRRRAILPLPLLLLAAPLLLVRPAAAFEFSGGGVDGHVDATNTFTYSYFGESDDNDTPDFEDNDQYHRFTNSLYLDVGIERFRLSTRMDIYRYLSSPVQRICGDANARNIFWCRPQRRGLRYDNQFALQRITLTYQGDAMDVALGDYYVALGKGMALSSIKIDDLGQDTTIRGGKVGVRLGDFALTLVGGEFNPVAVDLSTDWNRFWKPDPVLAARAEYAFLDSAVLVGAHAVYVMFNGPTVNSRDPGTRAGLRSRDAFSVVTGTSLDLPSLFDGALSISGEVDFIRTEDGDGNLVRGFGAEAGSGLGVYASATGQVGDFTLLGEFKYYDNFRLRASEEYQGAPYILYYHQPPTLERIEAEIDDTSNTFGGHWRVDWSPKELGPLDLLVFGSFGFFVMPSKDEGGGLVSQERRIFDPFGGVELYWLEGQGHFLVRAGARVQTIVETGELDRRDVHLTIELEHGLWANHSMKASLFWQRRFKLVKDTTWDELDAVLEYKWSPYLSAAFTFDLQGDPGEGMHGARRYYGGQLRFFATPATHFTLRVGGNRGGLKCVSGICRFFPAFTGVRFTAVIRL